MRSGGVRQHTQFNLNYQEVNQVGTKGKTWIAKKSVRKAFDAAIAMRKITQQEALQYVHSGVQLIIANEEHNILFRKTSYNGFVQDYVEQLIELDEMVAKLSKYL
jgi:hypothetical protein